ncbi:MAG: dihydrofolate reductase family protein [Hyphomicrobiales bacterium]
MGIIVAHEFVTLDGVMQSPGTPDEDREGGFEHGGWQAPYVDSEAGEIVFEHYRGMEALLLGRKTYDIFAGYWPTAPSDIPFTDLFNRSPKYVVSRSLAGPKWQGTTILRAADASAIAPLKERHNEVHVVGSGSLMRSLLANNLVDRLNLWVYPVLLGTGKRLFGEGIAPAAMRLLEARPFPSGAVLLNYERAGRPAYGNMAEA